MMGIGEKTPKYKKGKNPQFGYPPISPSTKWRLTVFRCPKTPKTSRNYLKWERVPNGAKEKIGLVTRFQGGKKLLPTYPGWGPEGPVP